MLRAAIADETTPLPMLQDIREITGYLLIVSVYADVVPLTSLNIVRGRTLFNHLGRNYSIFISNNYRPDVTLSTGVGLRQLQMPSLHGELQSIRDGSEGERGGAVAMIWYDRNGKCGLNDKKHLKNVGPIRHNEPPHAHSADVASGTVARRLRIDVYDDDNDNS